jgi:REP element-mobilizing transposase RayT
LFRQFQETSAKRGWLLLAAAVMANHVHLVVGVPGDPDPAVILRDYKAYGSRSLNRRWAKPASDTWWTESGSKRKLSRDENVAAAVRYVRDQPHPLVVWIHPRFRTGERGT